MQKEKTQVNCEIHIHEKKGQKSYQRKLKISLKNLWRGLEVLLITNQATGNQKTVQPTHIHFCM